MGKEHNLEGLADIQAAIFRQEILAELEKESAEPDYKRQVDFANCQSRAVGLSKKAVERCKNIYAYAILMHRETEHGKDNSPEEVKALTAEKKYLEGQMPKEDIKLASTRGWWRP